MVAGESIAWVRLRESYVLVTRRSAAWETLARVAPVIDARAAARGGATAIS